MSAEIKFEGIPPKFQPLFEGRARNVISKAKEMVNTASIDDQQDLLENSFFCSAVNSALFDLDQRSRDARINFISSFDKKNQPLAFRTFLGGSN